MKTDLSINLAGIKLDNPIMNASGVFGFGPGFANIENPENFGALITKTITLKPRQGNPQPWIIKTEAGLINSVGLANEGIDLFVSKSLPQYRSYEKPVIASIAGDNLDDYEKLIKILDRTAGISAFEINTSCPNVHNANIPFGTEPDMIFNLVSKIREKTRLPLIVKLTPNVGKIEKIAKAAEKAGADALSLINTVLGLKISIKTRKPYLGGNTGGISGQAIKPHGIYRVFEASKAVKIPIIGVGGIAKYEDVLEYIIAGATAVEIGTANYFESNLTTKILSDLNNFLSQNKISKISEIIGSLKLN